MYKIYFAIFIVAGFAGFYFYGFNIAKAKCRIQYLEQSEQNQKQILQDKKVIHEKVYKTNLGDIRSILHDKYTIAD